MNVFGVFLLFIACTFADLHAQLLHQFNRIETSLSSKEILERLFPHRELVGTSFL